MVTPNEQKEAFDVELALARAYFDSGDLDSALVHAEKAVKLDPGSELAAVVLGFTYLGLAELTPFGIVEALGDSDDEKESETSGSSDSDQSAGSSPAAALGGISALELTEEEFSLLAVEVDLDDPTLPVIVPKCAAEARRDVLKLKLVNKAITVICPFVDPQTLVPSDSRHDCTPSEGNRKRSAMSHLLWAFTHLIEALAFHSVVTYSTSGSDKTNLELRVQKIQDINVTDLSQLPAFVEKLENVTILIDRVMPVSGECSEAYPQTQLTGLINDLLSVSVAFSKIDGIPPSLTQSIRGSVGELERIKNSTSGAAASQEQSRSIKADFTKQMSSIVAEKISEADVEEITPEQAASVCNSYSDISSGQADDSQVPELCRTTALLDSP